MDRGRPARFRCRRPRRPRSSHLTLPPPPFPPPRAGEGQGGGRPLPLPPMGGEGYCLREGEAGMRTHRIAAIGGDGIGPEVVEAGLEVLAACADRDAGFALAVERFDWGSDYYRRHGVMMPADGAERLRAFDAILFGAVGSPGIPDHVTLWGL